MENRMNETEFWALVETVGWGRIDCDFNRCKAVLLEALPTYEAAQSYADNLTLVYERLNDEIMEWEESAAGRRLQVSDDSYSDLLHHIIGLGREEYNAAFTDPRLVFHRAQAGAYEESFGYCTPYKADYEPTATKLAHAEEGLAYWQSCLEANRDSVTARSEVARRSEEVQALREKLQSEGGTPKSPEAWKAERKALRAKEEAFQTALRAHDLAKADARKRVMAAFEEEWAAKESALRAEFR